jgi:hypothetical protein
MVDPRTSLERRLAKRCDNVSIVGKCIITVTGSGTSNIVVSQVLTYGAFGFRVSAIGALYAKWRIQSLNFFVTGNATVTSVCIFDDASVATDLPTSAEAVYECRCSAIMTTIGCQLLYKPVSDIWSWTSAQSSVSDARDLTPATLLFYQSGPAATLQTECFFSLEFSGAV